MFPSGKQLMLVFLFIILSTSSSVNIFEFKDRRADGGLKIQNTATASTPSSITFCVDFDIRLVKYSRIISTPGTNDLEMIIPETLDRFYTKFKGVWYLTPPLKEIDPYSFGTYCMSYDAVYHRIIFAYNGDIIFEKIDPEILGPEQLSKNFLSSITLGEKNNLYTFSGDITRMNIWGKALSKSQVQVKSSCDGLGDNLLDVGDPDLVNWEENKWKLSDGISIKNFTSYPCNSQQAETLDVLMPYGAANLFDAIDTCTVLGGKMGPPKSEEDMKRMLTEVKADVDKSDCAAYLWIPYKKNTEEQWALFDGTDESLLPEFFREPPWLAWAKGQPNGLHLEECTIVAIGDDTNVFDSDCNQKDYCYMCEFEDITYFNIRGLCSTLNNMLDISYLVDMEKVSRNIEKGVIWTGYRKSKIMFDRNLTKWKITSLSDDVPILTLANKEKLPVGPLMWDMPFNICQDDKSERKLFLTSCNETEFACNDGNCIPIQERCDGEATCLDDSDELSCKTIYWPEGGKDAYTQELPPTPYTETVGDKLPVLIFADIQNVLELKELEGFWQAKVVFDLLWFDQRLLMQNLKHDDSFNILADEERQLIWFPEIIFGNNDNVLRMVLDEKASIIVKREGDGFPNDFTDLIAAELFYGYDNPFLYSRTYSTKFECNFNLKSYPFDTQECVMDLKVPNSQMSELNITAHKVKYTGPKDLPQFEVESVETKNVDGKALFVMKFQRKFSYHLISVYIPSLSLFIISLVTMHIDIEHFEATIMVHLTAMLVVYTLFQAISVSLPKTAYIKLMDVWLLFGLVLPFISFILTLIEEIIKNGDDSQEDMNLSTHQTRKGSARSTVAFENTGEKRISSKKKRIQFVSRVILPASAGVFVVLYIVIAVYLYHFPTLEY